jgi:DNA repair protein RecN (Recombination protein N)
MLRELRITNFAIIDELHLSFALGMNVLTGETGAGKSIIMRAIGLLCGERATADLIRTDAQEAEIEGIFDLDGAGRAVLQDSGLEPADELLVRRVVSRSGKGRISINGGLATAGVLSQLGSRLIHVYGQHQHALLLKPESHLDFLDEFGKLDAPRRQMAHAYQTFRDASDRLAALAENAEASKQRLELLRFQATELRAAHPTRGEESQLQQEREVQRHAEKLSHICRQSEEALYSGDQAIAAALARVATQLREAGRIDATFRGSAEALEQSAAQIEEVASDLRRAAERIRHDPERLEQIEERLAVLTRLKRKYDCEADALVERLAELDAELTALEGSGVDTAALRQEVRAHATNAWALARELSRARHAAVAQLEKRMTEELRTLGMRHGVFRVVFTVSASDAPQAGWADPTTPGGARLSALGADSVEFFLSANPGEDPKPLARIASGGELSRIMLALKTLTAGAGEVPTLIFDEVDAGIGGAVAEAVGKRLHTLGRTRQILCITHLPQIAAQADHHFAVEKHVAKGRTTTSARALQDDERVRELTRMLGGAATAESLRYARRLIEGVAKSNQT